MAAITPTLDNNTPFLVGHHWVVTGTIQVPDTSANHVNLAPTTGAVLYMNIEDEDDDDTTFRVKCNYASDFTTATNGRVAIQSSAADLYRFEAGVLF